MIHKFAVLTSVILSVSSMVLHQDQPPIYGLNYNDNPTYNFAYEVNEARTGDVKRQHESRRGDIVLGQYSLVQPDGVERTVDYRADDHSGFLATVNNQGRYSNGYPSDLNINNGAATRQPNLGGDFQNVGPVQSYQGWPTPNAAQQTPTSAGRTPLAVSTSSFVQTISHGPVSTPQNGHNNLWA